MSRIKQADNNEPDTDLGLRPALEVMEQIADEAISGLREAHETRLLQNLMPQCASYVPYDTRKLLSKGNEAVKWLREANAQNLLQKLANFEMPLSTPNMADLSSHVEIARSNLTYAQETRLLGDLKRELVILQIPHLANLEEAAEAAIQSLRNANEILHLQNLGTIPLGLDVPLLDGLESACNKTGALLKEAYELRLSKWLALYQVPLKLPNLGDFATKALLVSGSLQTVHEAKILEAVNRRERKREKILKQCYFHAEWAGSDLQRWDRVFAEYGKYPKHLKILNNLIDEAHSKFLEILAEMRNLREIRERCSNNPFLIRECVILDKQMKEFYDEQESKSPSKFIEDKYKADEKIKM